MYWGISLECGEGERMSDMIQFMAQLMVDVGRRDSQIQRALQVLQRAERYHPEDYSRMERRELGGWMDADDVERAIQILQEGQQ